MFKLVLDIDYPEEPLTSSMATEKTTSVANSLEIDPQEERLTSSRTTEKTTSLANSLLFVSNWVILMQIILVHRVGCLLT